MIYIVVSIIIGLICSVLATCIWHIGLFAIGAFGGFTLAVFSLSWASSATIENDIGRNLFLIIFMVVGGILALLFEHHVVIIATAIAGSYLIVFGVDCFLNSGFKNAIYAILHGSPTDYIIQNQTIHALLISMIVICIVGIIVQYRVTGRNVGAFSGGK